LGPGDGHGGSVKEARVEAASGERHGSDGEKRGLDDKLMGLDEAVERFVPDGAQVALGGFTINRNPMALAYAIARRKVRDLHIVCHSHGQALDVLVGAGCVALVEIAYGGNGRFAPTCVRFRRAAERGEIAVEDYTNNQMALRFLAGALGIPFIPTRSGLHTDIVRLAGFDKELRREHGLPADKLIVAPDPFGTDGDEVVLLPALTPDVALVHAQDVGDDGTVRIEGLQFADLEQAKSARAVVVTCERIVPAARLRENADCNSLPPFLVDAVVEVPWGAHPTACFRRYDYDPAHLNEYKVIARDDERFAAWLDEWVYGVRGHEEYLERVGGGGGGGRPPPPPDPDLGYTPGLDRR
jgi:glutaconate CoA-transferase subunit A